jgi:hypothetical protein
VPENHDVKWLFCVALLLCTSAHAQTTVRRSFDLDVPWVPTIADTGGKPLLVYELHLTNVSQDDLTLTGIEAFDATSGRPAGEFHGAALEALLGRPDRSKDKLTVPPGGRAVAYLSLSTAHAGSVLRHKVEYDVGGEHAVVEGGRFTVRDRASLLLGPPLRGGPWVAIYDASWERGHRRVLYAVNGKVHIPGRFAIDWIRLDDKGAHVHDDEAKPADWYGYGAGVIAVADATVAATRDDVAEPTSVVAGPSRVPIGDAAGNYVALDLGDGRYAFYEHLKPGSIAVKKGQHVRRGQAIGKLGFTGESTGPHLHFHVADNNALLDAEGLPYGIDNFTVLGTFPSIEAFGKAIPWIPGPADETAKRHSELPAPMTVVEFPGQ